MTVEISDLELPHAVRPASRTLRDNDASLRVFRMQRVYAGNEYVRPSGVRFANRFRLSEGELEANTASRYGSVSRWFVHLEIDIKPEHVVVENHGRVYISDGDYRAGSD